MKGNSADFPAPEEAAILQECNFSADEGREHVCDSETDCVREKPSLETAVPLWGLEKEALAPTHLSQKQVRRPPFRAPGFPSPQAMGCLCPTVTHGSLANEGDRLCDGGNHFIGKKPRGVASVVTGGSGHHSEGWKSQEVLAHLPWQLSHCRGLYQPRRTRQDGRSPAQNVEIQLLAVVMAWSPNGAD